MFSPLSLNVESMLTVHYERRPERKHWSAKVYTRHFNLSEQECRVHMGQLAFLAHLLLDVPRYLLTA